MLRIRAEAILKYLDRRGNRVHNMNNGDNDSLCERQDKENLISGECRRWGMFTGLLRAQAAYVAFTLFINGVILLIKYLPTTKTLTCCDVVTDVDIFCDILRMPLRLSSALFLWVFYALNIGIIVTRIGYNFGLSSKKFYCYCFTVLDRKSVVCRERVCLYV